MCAFTPRSRCWTIDARGDAATGTEDAEVSSQEGQEEQRCREQRAGPARQADQPRDLVGTHAEGGRDVQLLEGVIDDPPEIDASSGRPLAEGPGGRLLHPALVQGQPVGPEQGEQLAPLVPVLLVVEDHEGPRPQEPLEALLGLAGPGGVATALNTSQTSRGAVNTTSVRLDSGHDVRSRR
jgi:hypothetical protein